MEMRGLVGGDSQFVVEGVVPDLLHVVPVGHDTVLDGVFQGEDTWRQKTSTRCEIRTSMKLYTYSYDPSLLNQKKKENRSGAIQIRF